MFILQLVLGLIWIGKNDNSQIPDLTLIFNHIKVKEKCNSEFGRIWEKPAAVFRLEVSDYKNSKDSSMDKSIWQKLQVTVYHYTIVIQFGRDKQMWAAKFNIYTIWPVVFT